MNKHRHAVAKGWTNAPLPKFVDKNFAAALVQEGYYPSIEDAYLEVEPHIIERVRSQCAEYLANYQFPLCWQFAPLPRQS